MVNKVPKGFNVSDFIIVNHNITTIFNVVDHTTHVERIEANVFN